MNDRIETFTLTDDHVKLARRMNVWWWDAENGAPAIDPKRPYGNSSIAEDICEILAWPPLPDEDDPNYSEEYYEKVLSVAEALHKQMGTALQVILSSGSFEPGLYEHEKYQSRTPWRRVE